MSQSSSPFDRIKHTTEYDAEFWYARELMSLLGYDTWQRFESAIDRAKESCQNAGGNVDEEFLAAPLKTLDSGGRPAKDYILSHMFIAQ